MRRFISSLLLCCLGLSTVANAHDLILYVGDNPPFNSFTNRQPEGMAVEVVAEMLARSGISSIQKDYPWARAVENVARNPNQCAYTMGRIAEREKKYSWIGPIASIQGVFFGLSERHLQVKSLDDARKLRVGDIRQGANAVMLEKLGFTIDYANSEDQNLKKLLAGHIDLYPAGSFATGEIAKRLGIAPNKIEPLMIFNTVDLYLACNPNSKPQLLEQLQKSLDSMRSDKKLKQIYDKYQDKFAS
ncbi:transporter substrate-binding domain-containing protein [Chitinibacter bivalviorum]|uniref:Transporter substrate-binding domain-containing protein n=1 Tax=Chitinibacter bivalviorum TaxID=2739434 RepID=A0A7H9BIY2_9NEIS|nr:transporter substrate-binding domain-containing protein [Chitinibacter bivalviorum]QLG88439.1 transporter substrate-binding domain-containing protein [Chitinibacter bivalviorum]